MAAGLSVLSAVDVLARETLPLSRMDQSQRIRRSIFDRFRDGGQRSGTIGAGTAVSTRKHTEMMFRGVVASCYPAVPMGAKGVVTNISRRPN
jgi:hypothetical protein